MTSIQAQLWADQAADAVGFYRAAFGAVVVHQVGDGQDVVAQLAVGEDHFWVASADVERGRPSPTSAGGATGRVLLVVDDPDAVVEAAVAAGATLLSAPADEHGWRIGRVVDPEGHEWEVGHPTGPWPPG